MDRNIYILGHRGPQNSSSIIISSTSFPPLPLLHQPSHLPRSLLPWPALYIQILSLQISLNIISLQRSVLQQLHIIPITGILENPPHPRRIQLAANTHMRRRNGFRMPFEVRRDWHISLDGWPHQFLVAVLADGEFAELGDVIPFLAQQHVVAAAFRELGELFGELDKSVHAWWSSVVVRLSCDVF